MKFRASLLTNISREARPLHVINGRHAVSTTRTLATSASATQFDSNNNNNNNNRYQNFGIRYTSIITCGLVAVTSSYFYCRDEIRNFHLRNLRQWLWNTQRHGTSDDRSTSFSSDKGARQEQETNGTHSSCDTAILSTSTTSNKSSNNASKSNGQGPNRPRRPPIFGSSLELVLQQQQQHQDEMAQESFHVATKKEEREDCPICAKYSQVSKIVLIYL